MRRNAAGARVYAGEEATRVVQCRPEQTMVLLRHTGVDACVASSRRGAVMAET